MFFIYEIFIPIVSTIGLIGNCLCAVILFRGKDKNAFTVYLKTLTFSDILILFSGILRFACSIARDNMKKNSSLLDGYCTLIVGFGLGNFFSHLSSYLITVMSIERFVAVVFPFQRRIFVLEKYPHRVVAILLLIQVILRTPTVIWTYVASREDCATNETVYYLEYREWSRDIVFRRTFFYILSITDRFIPVMTVICMNAGILITLKRRPTISLKKSNLRKEDSKGTMEKHRITITLVVLSIFYVVTSVSNMVLSILVTLRPEFTIRSKEYYLFSVLINAVIFLVAMNAANDFVIYVMSSKRFRELFLQTYCVCGTRKSLKVEETEQKQTCSRSASSGETSLNFCPD